MLLHITRSLRQWALRSPPTSSRSGICPLSFPFDRSSTGAVGDPTEHPPKAVPVHPPRAHRPSRTHWGIATASDQRSRRPGAPSGEAGGVQSMGLASDPPPGCLEVAVVEIHVSTWKTPETFCRRLPRSAEVGASLAGGAMPGQQAWGG